MTLLFAQEVYEQVAEAYIAGLERLAANGGDLKRVASVASFFISRIDTADRRADRDAAEGSDGCERASAAARLAGKVAIANAKLAYQRYQELFSGPRWQALADQGRANAAAALGEHGHQEPQLSRRRSTSKSWSGPIPSTPFLPRRSTRFATTGGRARASWKMSSPRSTRWRRSQKPGSRMKEVTDKLLAEGVQLFSDAFEKLLTAVDTQSQAAGSRQESTA